MIRIIALNLVGPLPRSEMPAVSASQKSQWDYSLTSIRGINADDGAALGPGNCYKVAKAARKWPLRGSALRPTVLKNAMSGPDFISDLAFLHLSDIHFRKGAMGDPHDGDADLRNEIEFDLRRVATKVQKIDGIIISGDIAYSGHPDEFEYAIGWIEHIREIIGCPKRGVMVTPGNHDVDRNLVGAGSAAEDLQKQIRAAASLAARDQLIAKLLRDPERGPELLKGLDAYNAFAKEYGCEISGAMPYWERDFALGNKATLKIRGMTSPLISGPGDDEVTGKMAYGAAQRTLQRGEGVIRAVVGHHPPSWTLEGDEADKAFTDRSAIQLFGHKHKQWPVRAGKGLRIIAGAVHPERDGINWDPRYNLLALRLDEGAPLNARVYPRKYSEEETSFIGDCNSRNEDFRDYTVEAG